MIRSSVLIVGLFLTWLSISGLAQTESDGCKELPVHPVRHPGTAAEAYFSPDGRSLICQAKLPSDTEYHVYTFRSDGTDARRINDEGADACSFFFPDGKHLVWTSTRDHPEMAEGKYSNPFQYPQGAELYVSDLKGRRVRRLTENAHYDSEVSVSPDGEWILFTRQIGGRTDLWRMHPDGTDEFRITNTPGWQEGGAFYLPDSRTILFRAWRYEHQKSRGMPMTVFTIRDDGTERTPLTSDAGTNWAPYPAPDGKRFVFVKVLPPGNYEIYMMNLEDKSQRRLTCDAAFDGFPSISADGQWMVFTSGRGTNGAMGDFHLFLMDLSSLGLGPQR